MSKLYSLLNSGSVLRRCGVFHQAVGKGLWERRLRDDPQLCVEVRKAGTAQIDAVWESREVCGSRMMKTGAAPSDCMTCETLSLIQCCKNI